MAGLCFASCPCAALNGTGIEPGEAEGLNSLPADQWRGAGQIIGGRSEQQDACGHGEAVLADGRRAPLVVLVDGMGGHEGGALAANIALDAFLHHCAAAPEGTFTEALNAALLAANRAIADEGQGRPALRDMGCTLVAAAIDGTMAHYVSVGDSILWLVRRATLERLNADHSMAPLVDAAVARGEMTEADAQDQRSGLRSALTGRPISLVDARSVELRAGDALLLASDGIFTLVPGEVGRIIAEQESHGPQRIIESMLDRVETLAPPDQDNCTLAWLSVGAPVAAVAAPRRKSALAYVALAFGLILAAAGSFQLLRSAGLFDGEEPIAAQLGGTAGSGSGADEASRQGNANPSGGLRKGEEYPGKTGTSGVSGGTTAKSAPKAGPSEKPVAGTAKPATDKKPAAKEPGKDGAAQPATKSTAAPQEKPSLSNAGQESIAVIKPEIDQTAAAEGPDASKATSD